MRDRLAGLAERLAEELVEIDASLAKHRKQIEQLQANRRELEEEVVEARLVLNQMTDAGFKVQRRADGVIEASVAQEPVLVASSKS